MLQMQISTIFAHSYPGSLPPRASVVRAAAKEHSLKPELVASIILVEQWDQSKNEDAADYQSAVSVMSKNTSIGLGQVVVSTAKRHELFSDLLSSGVRSALTHEQIATLLASDEFNIFAVAKFLRHVADQGATKDINHMPNTKAEYPNINMPAYSQHSKNWNSDNIKAIASEYTSRQWDDGLVLYWSDLMDLAYRQIQNAHVF